jgi:LysR family hydrogen peroxide-inducible transcriptional activator
MPTIRQLRYLVALERHRHFGKAADACAVSQPALSMQIRELETELGSPLVERRPGAVVFTEVGLEAAHRAEKILTATQDLVDFARHHGRILTGRLRFGIIPSLAPYVLPQILPALQREHPALVLELRESQTKTLLDELDRGQLDAVMLALPATPGEFESVPLFADPFLLAVPADDPLPAAARVTAGDIESRRLILLEEGHCLRDQALAYCSAIRGETLQALGATSLTTVMQMVAAGYGATLVPQIALPVEVRDTRVKVLRFAEPEPGRTIGIAWRRSSARKADFQVLATLIGTVFARTAAAA